MSRQYTTNDYILRYSNFPHPLFTDTMFSETVFKHGNNNAQVYGTSFGCKHFYKLNWRVTLMRHCHQSSSVMVSHLRWSWLIPRKILAVIFVRSYVRLTDIIRRPNPTHLGSQPLWWTLMDWSAAALEIWLRRSLQSACGTIFLSWKPVSTLVMHMTINRLKVRFPKPWWKGTLYISVPNVNMNGMNG